MLQPLIPILEDYLGMELLKYPILDFPFSILSLYLNKNIEYINSYFINIKYIKKLSKIQISHTDSLVKNKFFYTESIENFLQDFVNRTFKDLFDLKLKRKDLQSTIKQKKYITYSKNKELLNLIKTIVTFYSSTKEGIPGYYIIPYLSLFKDDQVLQDYGNSYQMKLKYDIKKRTLKMKPHDVGDLDGDYTLFSIANLSYFYNTEVLNDRSITFKLKNKTYG